MIVPAKNFSGTITSVQIEDAAEFYGYEGYIPYGFINDLVFAWTHTAIGDSITAGIQEHSSYDISLRGFLNIINKNSYNDVSAFEFVFKLLQAYNKRTNFRDVEFNRENKLKFNWKEEKKQYNYDFNLRQIDPKILSFLDIEIFNSFNEVELTEEVKDVLRFYNSIESKVGIVEEQSEIVRERMKNYSQLVKISKHRYLYPTFKYDYSTKNLYTKIPIVEQIDRSKSHVLVDISSSTKNESKYGSMYKAMLLHFLSSMKEEGDCITFYYFSNEIRYIKKVTNPEELKALINTPFKIHVDVVGWQDVYDYIENKLQNEYVVLITDGTDSGIKIGKSQKNKWIVISFEENTLLRRLSTNTEGKFIKI